jgi:hypothetical protein
MGAAQQFILRGEYGFDRLAGRQHIFSLSLQIQHPNLR